MFGKMFGGKKDEPGKTTAKPPRLAPRTFEETVPAALDYAAYMVFDGQSGPFIPSIIQFTNMGAPDGASHVRRFAGASEEGVIDNMAAVQSALSAFETRSDAEWEVVIFEATQRLPSGDTMDCFTGYARNNETGDHLRFARSFTNQGNGRAWAEDLMAEPFQPS